MITFLWIVYLTAVVLRLLWWLFFRLNITAPVPDIPAASSEGISIVICSHNNLKGLKQLIPALLQQEYPLFEIIVVDDRSSDQTSSWLEEQKTFADNLHALRIDRTPEDWNPKKYALTRGISIARYPFLALTDSDCFPSSSYWLRFVAEGLSRPNTSIFLGFSPYEHHDGLLNRLIQTETLFTAFQYFSLANQGMTYMGVGRNLGYKSSFLASKLEDFPYRDHIGGDDDLLINSLSSGNDAATCTHPDSFLYSVPPFTWKQWIQQKRRHLSAGQHYKSHFRFLLGTYWWSALSFWLCFAGLGFCAFSLCLLWVHFCTFVVGTILLFPLFRIFKARRLIPLFLFWDFLYIAVLSSIGLSTFGVKNKKWS